MLTPVIFHSPNQRHLYSRLIHHCKELDGTEIVKVEGPEPKVGYPAVCNVAFRTVCKAMEGKPFVWLEADSIPVKKGWLKALEAEWQKAQAFGKEIVWTTDSNLPHDRCTGIGVYGPSALTLVPEHLSHDGFDGYILTHHADKIHKTPLIQHSYGSYDHKGDCTLHRNPKVRDDAVIFHKDQFQDLISIEKHFGHSGDLGDIIFALALIKEQGGGYLWLYDRPFTKQISSRFETIAPLLMSQPYIKATALSNGRGVQYDLSPFRSHYRPDRNLLASQCNYALKTYGLPFAHGETAWLTAKKDKRTKGRVVIARSPRYHSRFFPWKRLLNHYGDACVFVGLKDEHDAFTREHGVIEHLPTGNMLEVAEAIAGSDLFIGNQSSPNAVAEGLKHPRILECSDWVPDCIYPNHGVIVYDDHVDELPAAGGKEREVFERKTKFRHMDILTCPPKGWRYPELVTTTHFDVISRRVARMSGVSLEEAQRLVYEHNCNLNVEFFRDRSLDSRFSKVMKALSEIK